MEYDPWLGAQLSIPDPIRHDTSRSEPMRAEPTLREPNRTETENQKPIRPETEGVKTETDPNRTVILVVSILHKKHNDVILRHMTCDTSSTGKIRGPHGH